MHFNHILLTTDFSEESKNAFDLAAFEHQMEDTKLTLLHVVEEAEIPIALQKEIITREGIESYKKELLTQKENQLTSIWNSSGHAQDVEIVTVLAISAAAGICNYAKENEIDLIVMARKGQGILSEFFLGTVTQRVLHSAHCPVLVTPVKSTKE